MVRIAIRVAVVLLLGVLLMPLVVEGQQVGKLYRIAFLGNSLPCTWTGSSRAQNHATFPWSSR